MQQQEQATRVEDVIDLSRDSATPEPPNTGDNQHQERRSAELQRMKDSWRAASRRLSQSAAASTPVSQRKSSRHAATPLSATKGNTSRYLSSPGQQKQQPVHNASAEAATARRATAAAYKQQRLKYSAQKAAAVDSTTNQQHHHHYMADLAYDEDGHGHQVPSSSSDANSDDSYDSQDDFLDDRSEEELEREAQRVLKEELSKRASTPRRKRLRRNATETARRPGHSNREVPTVAPSAVDDEGDVQDNLEDELDPPQLPQRQQQQGEATAAVDSTAAAAGLEDRQQGDGSIDAPDEPLDDDGMTEVRNMWMPQDLQMHFRLYLQYLLQCKIKEAEGVDLKAVVLSPHPTESQYIMRLSAERMEGLLLQWRSQVTASTWVSALPTLPKALLCLPELSVLQPDYTAIDDLQRCALCYRKCTGWKLLSLEGVPVKDSGYFHDHAAGGITAPRRGERANTAARKGDFGDEQFGGSSDDTGSSTTDDEEASWSREQWEALKRFERHGTQAARIARRLHRKGEANADWAFDAGSWKLPPGLAEEDDDAGDAGQQQQQRGGSSCIRHSASTVAAANGRSKRGGKSCRRKMERPAGTQQRCSEQAESDSDDFIAPDEEVLGEDEDNSGGSSEGVPAGDTSDSSSSSSEASEQQQRADASLPFASTRKAVRTAAAAAAADECTAARGGRYSTRSMTARMPKSCGAINAAEKAALAKLAAMRGVRKLDFEAEAEADSAEVEAVDTEAAAPAAAAGGGADIAAHVQPIHAAAAAAEAALVISSTDDEADGMTLAQREKQLTPSSRPAEQQDKPQAEQRQQRRQRRQRQQRQQQSSSESDEDDRPLSQWQQQSAVIQQQQQQQQVQQLPSKQEAQLHLQGLDDVQILQDAVDVPEDPLPAEAGAAAAAQSSSIAVMRRRRHARRLEEEEHSDNEPPAEQQQQQQQPDNKQPAGMLKLSVQQQQQPDALQQQQPVSQQQQQVADAAITLDDSSPSGCADVATQQRSGRKAKRRRFVLDDEEQQQQQQQQQQLCCPATGGHIQYTQCTPNTRQQQQQPVPRVQPQHSPGKQLLSHKSGYRKRGFLVGGGMCLARCRAHHVLQHWHYKVSALLLGRYNRLKAASQSSLGSSETQTELQEKAVEQVVKQLYQPACKGLQHMASLFATYKPTQRNERLTDSEKGRQLLQLLKEVSDALEV